jgi:hypothetical protein
MPDTLLPRRSHREPEKGKTADPVWSAQPPRRADLNRLAAYLAAEWRCRHDDCAHEAFEVTP